MFTAGRPFELRKDLAGALISGKQRGSAITGLKNILHLYWDQTQFGKPLERVFADAEFTDKRWVQPHANRGRCWDWFK
jgi:hypothetical protein